MLDNSPIVGGVHKLRTTSFNSVTNILSSMAMISRITGGVLAGIPLKLTFGKKTTTVPGTEQQTTIPIIGLIYKGSVRELAESGQKTALEFAGYRKRIEYIEDIARKQLDKEMGLGIYTEAETDEDIVAEFYPEQVGATGLAAESGTKETRSFVDLINENITDSNLLPMVDKFVSASAKALGKTNDEITAMAAENFSDFISQFNIWLKKSAVPGEKHPGAEPETPKKEDISGAEAKTTTQGPQPSAWDPYKTKIQQRYPADKAAIIKTECETRGIMITGLVPREAHGLLLDSVKAEMEEMKAEQEAPEPEETNPDDEIHTEDCRCPTCCAENPQAAAHKKMLDEKEARRKALYGDKPREDHEVIKTDGDFDENAPQKMAGDPAPASKADLRDRYIVILEQVGKIDRIVWMKSKQQVGLLSSPNVHTMPLEKLIEWATLAQSMTEGKKDIQFS